MSDGGLKRCGKVLALGVGGALRCSNTEKLCPRCGYCEYGSRADAILFSDFSKDPDSPEFHCQCDMNDILAW